MGNQVQSEIRHRMTSMDTTIEDLENTLALLRQTMFPDITPPGIKSLSAPSSSITIRQMPGKGKESEGKGKDVEKGRSKGKEKAKGKDKDTVRKALVKASSSKKREPKRSISNPDLVSTSSALLPHSPSFSKSSFPSLASVPQPSSSSYNKSSKSKSKSKGLSRAQSAYVAPYGAGVGAGRGRVTGSEDDEREDGFGSRSGTGMGIGLGQPEGSKKRDAMSRSQSHGHGHGSGGSLFGQLFGRRASSHKPPKAGLLTVPTRDDGVRSSPTSPISSTGLTPSSTSTPTTTISDLSTVTDPHTLLNDLAKSIMDLRHQHSSLLTLLPLSTGAPLSSPSDVEEEEEGDDENPDFHSLMEGSIKQLKGTAIARGRSRSNTGTSVDSDQDGTTTPLRELEGKGRYDEASGSSSAAVSAYGNSTSRWNSPYSGRRGGHTKRSSLSSMYAEVASIYYDAELVPEGEDEGDDRTHRNDSAYIGGSLLTSRVSEEDVERALEEYEARASSGAGAIELPAPLLESSRTASTSLPLATQLATTADAFLPLRTNLPSPTPPHEPSLMGMLRKNVGKDLSAISFDVTFNEPLSLLQKLAEEVEYVDLLKLASLADDPIERIAHIAAFAVSQYASTRHRTSRKPFNPLMGETFELISPSKGMRFIAEKVNHHPPKLACHAEGEGWRYWCTTGAKNRLAGMSLEILPTGRLYVELSERKERYSWLKPPSYMRNLVAGTRYVETIGEMTIVNETSGEKCVMTFKEGGWSGGGRNGVSGVCWTGDGVKAAWIEGNWESGLSIRYGSPKDPSHPLFIVNPWPPKPERNYGFTQFAISLNAPIPNTSPLSTTIPLSDSRFRPDQRLLEEGQFEEADKVKIRLEEAQRGRKALGREVRPRWFEAAKGEGENEEWNFTGKYWELREEGRLQEECPKDLW